MSAPHRHFSDAQGVLRKLRGRVPMVVVVDDDADLRLLMRDAIEMAEEHRDGSGVEIVEFESATAALGHLLDGDNPPPDLIYMDVEMPGTSGLEAARRIKSDVRLRHVPLVVLSGLQDVAARGRREGGDADEAPDSTAGGHDR